VHNSFLCYFGCLPVFTKKRLFTEKKQKTSKKQNNAHPSAPNRLVEALLHRFAAFVFIQHLAPGGESMLTDILARSMQMPVHKVQNDMPVEPNNVYVIPLDVSMTISEYILKLQPLVTTKSEGQGFGLAVCKRLVEALHGTITFDSEEGNGTKFTVKLPITN